MAIKKFSAKEVKYYRRRIKELINLRGFNITYYSLNLNKTKNTAKYSSLYNEAPQDMHFYTRYDIRGFIHTSNADFWNKKFGLEYIQQEPTNIIDAQIYYLTPQDKWASDFGENTMLPQEYEESDLFLKIVPKIGDYLRYPIDGDQFFEVTTIFPDGWDFLTTYLLRLIQRPNINSEEDLSIDITTPNVENPNQMNRSPSDESFS